MLSFFSEFNWTLIFIVIAVSALVAYVGDIVGMKMGKKRISLFGVRPRYTSKIITLLTGCAIAIATLALAGATSETVRTALFSMKYLQGRVTELTASLQENREDMETMNLRVIEGQEALKNVELQLFTASSDLKTAQVQLKTLKTQAVKLEKNKNALEKEMELLKSEKKELESSIQKLHDESAKLKIGLRQLSEGRMAVFSGELLSQVAVAANPDAAHINLALDQLLKKAQDSLSVRGGKGARINITIAQSSKAATLEKLKSSKDRHVLRLIAKSNAVTGQDAVGEIKIFKSNRIYQEGELLSRQGLGRNLTREEAADILYNLLRDINRKAVAKGVLPDPLTGSVGNLDSILFFDAVDQMTDSSKNIGVRVLAEKDIYTEGPVSVSVIVENQ